MDTPLQKIKGLEEIEAECKPFRSSGKRIVFTNGCFDLLHPGHVRYLHAARQLGDFLIVAVNSDASVRSIKGPKRPILDAPARAELVAALSCVDRVVVFDEDNPLSLIQRLLPHVLVKGGDWEADQIIGSDVVKAAGGEVRRIPFVDGFSSTDIIEKIMELYG
jgi:D-beta-D-heptose 7-phosphate kinase/D-beta-D-heptose 1-phosphate adenosyltransferase